jgi:predicted transcriptional regulator
MKLDTWKSGRPMSHTIKKAKSLLVHNDGIQKAKSLTKSLIVKKETFEPVQKPYRSKMMICIEILCTLSSKGPMSSTQLMHKVEVDIHHLMPHLRLLRNRALVEKKNFGETEAVYFVTERGLKVLKVVSPIIKEAHKIQMRNFALISSALSGAGYS